jgi:hypothetical protein
MYFYAGAPHEAAGAVTIERGIGGTKRNQRSLGAAALDCSHAGLRW